MAAGASKSGTVPKPRRYAVVMAGGSGTRFWPWSRTDRPKQLLPLAGRMSMLGETLARMRNVVPARNVLVVTGKRLRRAIGKTVPELPADALLCEAVGRNTAACIGWAALEILRQDPDGVMIVLPADHIVSPLGAFERTVETALAIADRERLLVTFGIKPTAPETGYGYIHAREHARGGNGASPPSRNGALRVKAFHEKPSLTRARRFVRDRNFYWNSGMFAWRADVVLEEIRRHAPALGKALDEMERGRRGKRIAQATVDRVYAKLDAISIDHAVMERSERVAMVPADFAWSDIGSWDAVADLWPRDAHGNSSRDPVIALDSRNNLVATHGKPVALVGVEGLAVVDSGDAILVCRRECAQDVRAVVSALDAAGLGALK
jgi:mannose-1-phosphate guanylyltransferase